MTLLAHAAAKPRLAAEEFQKVAGDEIMETLKDIRRAKKVRMKN